MKGMGKYESFNSTASSGLSMSYYLTANLSGEGVVRVIQQNNLTRGKYESYNSTTSWGWEYRAEQY